MIGSPGKPNSAKRWADSICDASQAAGDVAGNRAEVPAFVIGGQNGDRTEVLSDEDARRSGLLGIRDGTDCRHPGRRDQGQSHNFRSVEADVVGVAHANPDGAVVAPNNRGDNATQGRIEICADVRSGHSQPRCSGRVDPEAQLGRVSLESGVQVHEARHVTDSFRCVGSLGA